MSRHRQFPGAPYRGIERGFCCWCGTKILDRNGNVVKNRNWHASCVTQFKIRAWPAETRSHVWKRDKGICAACGKHHPMMNGKSWEAEHQNPLALANGDTRFWEPDNVRIYCRVPCHSKKTGQDRRTINLIRAKMNPKSP